MAFTYIILNCIFIACVLGLFASLLRKPTKAWWITLATLILLTLIFDNLAIWAGMFTYAPDKIMGIFVGLAPIEDFFYAIFAVLIIPLLWQRFKALDAPKGDAK